MNDATAAVLFLSTLGVLYQWPHLRTTAYRLLKWVAGILFTVGLMTMICESLASIESLQTVSPLYAAAGAGDRVRTAELLEYKHVQNDIKSLQTASACSARRHHYLEPPIMATRRPWRRCSRRGPTRTALPRVASACSSRRRH